MSLKERLKAIKEYVHSVEVGGEKYFFKYITPPQLNLALSKPDEQFNAVVFIQCSCTEKGEPEFEDGLTEENIELVNSIPATYLAVITKSMMEPDQKKPSGD